MKKSSLPLVLLAIASATLGSLARVPTAYSADPIETQDTATPSAAKTIVEPGDRIALIGGGWVERMHNHPWLEMMLTLEVPGVTFRNMGWSGDTVMGDARAVFGARPDGYQRLMRDLEFAAPNLAILCYGENEAHGTQAEREEFLKGYHKLVEDLKRKGCRIVMVIPRQREDAGPQFPNPRYYNSNLAQLADGIRKIATDHQATLVDLQKLSPDKRFTEEGVVWNDQGYQDSAREILSQLGYKKPTMDRLLPKTDSVLELRTAIKSKNEWFFHRYRPQNETYLFLFRKHEQGNNAVEVEQMEKFVRDGELKIAQWLTSEKWTPTP
ncbi:MAG: GDSL-type esterase/lipase family protein [Planctomycetota bacterium]|nr:GDSL-type esterase/lipase family protein [Planctomycetota bacterium]